MVEVSNFIFSPRKLTVLRNLSTLPRICVRSYSHFSPRDFVRYIVTWLRVSGVGPPIHFKGLPYVRLLLQNKLLLLFRWQASHLLKFQFAVIEEQKIAAKSHRLWGAISNKWPPNAHCVFCTDCHSIWNRWQRLGDSAHNAKVWMGPKIFPRPYDIVEVKKEISPVLSA